MPEFFSILGQIAIWVTLGLGIVVLNELKTRARNWYRERKLHPIARSVLANKRVHSLLVELRAKTHADRACVYLFHNGQTFSNKNPLWRLSCTQEYCREGISHEIDGLQNILASLFWEGIAPFFAAKGELQDGIKQYTHGKYKVFAMDVYKMEDSYFKRALVARGVKTNIITPLLDNTEEVVGYVSLNYCDLRRLPEEVNTVATELSETSANIHYELMKL